MANTISTIAASLLQDLYAIPPFSALKTAADSGSLFKSPEAFLASVFRTAEGSIASDKQLDVHYRSIIDSIVTSLPEDSIEYQYIVLAEEFRFIKEKYLVFRSGEVSSFYTTLKQDWARSLKLFSLYDDALKKLEPSLHDIDDTFEFVSLIDRTYLIVLAGLAKQSDAYLRGVVKEKIEQYNIMTTLRMAQLGKSRELIESLFVTEGLADTYALEHLEYRDVVSEIGLLLGMRPDMISVTTIETALFNREMATINKATFEGVSGARIIQYVEQLRFFISNMKVVFAGVAMGLAEEEITKRFVAYNAQ